MPSTVLSVTRSLWCGTCVRRRDRTRVGPSDVQRKGVSVCATSMYLSLYLHREETVASGESEEPTPSSFREGERPGKRDSLPRPDSARKSPNRHLRTETVWVTPSVCASVCFFRQPRILLSCSWSEGTGGEVTPLGFTEFGTRSRGSEKKTLPQSEPVGPT